MKARLPGAYGRTYGFPPVSTCYVNLLLQTEAMHQIVQGRPAYTEDVGGLCNVPIGASQHRDHGSPLRFITHLSQFECAEIVIALNFETQIHSRDLVSLRHDDCPFDAILQLSHIALPYVGLDRAQRVFAPHERSAV